MGIAVFADKFSGTLSSNEVINEVNKIFKYNNIKAPIPNNEKYPLDKILR